MAYHYTDQSRETEPNALPDVEVFEACADCAPNLIHSDDPSYRAEGCNARRLRWYYAHGSPGCLWDSDPIGPFDTEAEALTAAREAAGFCAHGIPDEVICEECPAPELWVLRETGPYGVENPRYYAHGDNPADPLDTAVWASEEGARLALAQIRIADRPGFIRGFTVVRLPDVDARRWGQSED